MKTITASTVFSALVTGTIAISAQADHHEGPGFSPVELNACTFKEGKNYDNLGPLTEAFNDWLKENDPDYTYWIFSPVFREDDEMDYAWIGGWPDGSSFGKSWDKWFADSGSAGPMFDDVSDCTGSLAASMPIHRPDGEWLEEGAAWFSRCTLEEDATLFDAISAHRSMAQSMQAMGAAPSYHWAFLPGLGFGDVEFDYYHVQAWGSFEAIGSGFDTYFNKGGWKKGASLSEGVMECASPNLYRFQLMRAGN